MLKVEGARPHPLNRRRSVGSTDPWAVDVMLTRNYKIDATPSAQRHAPPLPAGFSRDAPGHYLGVMHMLVCPERVEFHVNGALGVIRLQGSLGRQSATKLAQLARPGVIGACRSVLVDASLLNDIDDACSAALRPLWELVLARGGTIDVYGATGPASDALVAIAAGQGERR